MAKRGRKYREAIEAYDKREARNFEEAITLLKSFPKRGFDESVELSFNLGIDGRQADQTLRGTVMLPHGTGKEVRVVVVTQGDLETAAVEAGADHVGGADIIEKIQGGWLDFDLVIASPDMMGQVGKLGRILGPRGLMPNPKSGTVTREIGQAVTQAKAGRVEFRADSKSGNSAQAPIGKLSFENQALIENARAFSDAIVRNRPASTKGQYIRKLIMSSTMGPGVRIDPSALAA
jgi:large subunit ribosomal protein L1